MAFEADNIGTAYQWSISQMARAFGMDRKTVSKRLENAGVAPAGKKSGYATYALKDAGPALFAATSVAGFVFDPETMLPKDRKDWFQSENERLKFEQAMGQLVPLHDYHREQSILAKSVANTLDTLPDVLERDCGLSADMLSRVQESIDAVREQMYQRVIDDAEDAE